MDLWTELEAVRSRWNVLEHPFYQRWTSGELTRDELAVYAGEYRHAVVALADAAASAARATETEAPELRAGLQRHAAEEFEHIALWDGFLHAVGGSVDAEPAAETVACARSWSGDGDRPLLESLVTLYAIESGQPAVSETKRAGLLDRYGFERGPATAYFDLHAELDIEHAAAARAAIEPRLGGADVDALIARAEAALRGNWELLDGVEQRRGSPVA